MRRANRLRSSEEFQAVYRAGTRARTPGVVAIGARDHDEAPRVGFTCSRRVGGAVTRNRAKRRLRAAIEPFAQRLAPGAMVVLQGTPRTASEDFQKLVDQVGETLTKVGALDG